MHAVKYYPAGATTNSESGVTDVGPLLPRARSDGEARHAAAGARRGDRCGVDVFDRERVFVERVLAPLVKRFSALKIVMEHITTREAAQFVAGAPRRVAATITAHHLLLNRNALFQGGLQPHHYCLPVAEARGAPRRPLVHAATSGSPKFFLGTDSAPHARHTKETACGCAGIYTAHAGIELYAEAFAAAGALDKLDAFAGGFGAEFYGLPVNRDKITLVEEPMPCRRKSRSAATRWCRFAPAGALGGAWNRRFRVSAVPRRPLSRFNGPSVTRTRIPLSPSATIRSSSCRPEICGSSATGR